jgi:hypothetical protein
MLRQIQPWNSFATSVQIAVLGRNVYKWATSGAHTHVTHWYRMRSIVACRTVEHLLVECRVYS